MRKTILYFSVAALLLTLHIQIVQSQTTEFSYQGNVNSAGQPANGSYDFEFLLFDSLTGSQVGLDLIKRLRPVRFNWKHGGAADIGLIAEEVNLLEPLLTTINGNNEVEGVKYDRLAVVLVNAVREQQSRLEAQQNQLNKEKARNLSLEERLAKQEAAIRALKSVLCLENKAAAICNPRDNDITPLQRKSSDRRIKQ